MFVITVSHAAQLEQEERGERAVEQREQRVHRATEQERGGQRMGVSNMKNSRAVTAALKGLQDKIRSLEQERTQSLHDVQTFKGELARRGERFEYKHQLQRLTTQEQIAAARLSYERLLADKRSVDIRLQEIEETKRELTEARGSARDRAQDAHVSQLAAEAKVSVLERRVDESEQMARARNDRCARAQKTVEREQAAADVQLSNLPARVETLQRTLREERGARRLAEINHRRARNASARTNRYLGSILKVNQDLVTARTRTSTPPPSPSTARRSIPTHETREPSRLRRRKADRTQQLQGSSGHDAVHGFDVSTAVAEALKVGRAGGDPALSLQALYERIGFCALQADGGDGGFNSLPTSPRRARAVRSFEEASCEDEERFSCTRWPGDIQDSFFPIDRAESSWNPDPSASARRTSSRGPPKRNSGGGRGSREGNSPGKNGYSFAHSPTSRPTSVAERSPDVVRRLEGMASQLEREREDMNQWYKTVVHKANPIHHGRGEGADLDVKSLTRAIASLQEKTQQLEVVRQSLQAVKASPQTPTILSPTVCRRKTAALRVLQGLCQDVGGAGGSGAAA